MPKVPARLPEKSFRQRYDEYWERCKDKPTLEYKAPCCGEVIKARKPGPGEKWDSLVQCVHCDSVFWMEATCEGVHAALPQGVAQ